MIVAHAPLTRRERECLTALVVVHTETGLFTTITTPALRKLTGEHYAGTLGTLTQYGLVEREHGNDGIAYRMTEAGWAEFAGVSPLLANPDDEGHG